MIHDNELELRQQICDAGHRLHDLFFGAGNDGNVSARLSSTEILITPTNVSKGSLKLEDLIKITPTGDILSAHHGLRPSSEGRMHLMIYKHRPDVQAVVHSHPPTATGFAVANIALDRPFLPESVVRTGPTPLVPYAIPGGDELPESLIPYIQDHLTLLLGNHGVVAYGPTVTEALWNMETVELNARIYLTALSLGNVRLLSSAEVAALQQRYKPGA